MAKTLPTSDIIANKTNASGAAAYDASVKTKWHAEEQNSIYGRLVSGVYSIDAFDLWIGGSVAITGRSITAENPGGGPDAFFRQLVCSGTTGSKPWADGAFTGLAFYGGKQAVRAGYASTTQWDDANIGVGSIAVGGDCTASGVDSSAFGKAGTASGNASVAFTGTASGLNAFCSGPNNTASGDYSVALGGQFVTASGTEGVVLGSYLNNVRSQGILIGTGVDSSNKMTLPFSGAVGLGGNSTLPTVVVTKGTGAGTFGNVGVALGATAPGAYVDVAAATTSLASLRLRHGTAPTSPNDGDIWTTTAGLYARINGGTVGPLISSAGLTNVLYNNAANTFTAGLGAIDHLKGPSDQSFVVRSGAGQTMTLLGAGGIGMGQSASNIYIDATGVSGWAANTYDLGAQGAWRDVYTNRYTIYDKASGNGIKINLASPDYAWGDIIGKVDTRGATAPSMAAYVGNIYQPSFGTAPGEKDSFIEYHMPHDLAAGKDLYIHTHWSTAVTATGNVQWMFDLIYAKGFDQAIFEGTTGSGAVVTVGVTQAGTTAFKHEIAEVQCSASGGLITPAAVNVSITSGTPTLTAASALFTSADIGRTVRVVGAGVAAGNLDTTISAFTSTTQVTLATNASTTVTAQNAFRYRVLDTDKIEVDGIVVARVWRDAARTADTLDQAPFLHTADIHYQSTGIGTKNKAPNFYS